MKRKKIIGRVAPGIAASLFVIVVGGLLFLHTNIFKHYALQKIASATYASTGAKAEIGNLELSLSTLTARLHNITVHGTEQADQAPLVKIDDLTVAIKIQSFLHPQVTLRELLIEHPVVRIRSEKNGSTNLPASPPNQSTSHTSIFDLAIGHLQVRNGEVDYNDQKTPLDGDLYNLATDVHFDAGQKSYRGNLSYSVGRLRYANYTPLPHDLHATFAASPDRFTLDPAILKIGASDLVLHAGLSNYSSPIADGEYEIHIHSQDLAGLSPSAKPAGDVTLKGKVHYQNSPNVPFLQVVSTEGAMASEGLSATASGRTLQARSLRGQYQLAGGTLRVSSMKLETLGGEIAADALLQHLDSTPTGRVQTTLRGISLRAAQVTAHQSALKDVAISGALNGTVEAAWQGSVNTVQARADLTVSGGAKLASDAQVHQVPVNGAVHAVYDGRHNSLALSDTQFKIPSTTLNAQGQVSTHSKLQLHLATADLHELVAIANSFGAATAAPPAISGAASVSAIVTGSMQSPQISGHVSAQNLAVEGSEWSSANLDVQANPRHVAIQNGALMNAHGGQASFGAQASLHGWAYEPANRIQASLAVRGLRIEDLEPLAGQHLPVSGVLTSNVSFDGSQLDPKGSGSLQIASARAYDEPLQNVAMKFTGANGSIVSTLNLVAAPGEVNAELSYTPKTKAYRVRLDAPSVVLQKFRTLQEKNVSLAGTVSASVNGEGTLDNPQLAAVVKAPQLTLQQGSLGNLNADVRVAGHRADLNLQSNIASAPITAHGSVDLTGAYITDAAIDSGPISLAPLMAAYANGAPEGFQGEAEFHATLKGPLKDKSQIEAHLSVPTLSASYQSLQIGIVKALHADLVHSVLRLQPAELRGTGTSLRMQGTLPLSGNSSPNLSAQGSIDARVLRIVAPDVQSSGMVAIDIRTSGTASKPSVNGQINVKDVALTRNDAPVGVEKLDGTLELTSDRVQISSMTGQVGGGKISIGGSVAYRPSLQFNLALQGQSVRLRYPDGVRSQLDTNLAFSGTSEASVLNGRVLVDSLNFSPDLDISKFADQFSTGATVPSAPGFADTVKLGINLQTKENLNATSTQLSIAGRANLQVVGTAANPVITGRTNLTSGELFYRNVRYSLQRGVITFDDPNETRPVMNVSVTTTVEQYNLTLTMRGPLDKLTTSYVSDPPLATADIINLIARGKTTQEASASSQSTDSMIASGAASELSSSVQRLAGLSSLQIDPLLGGNNQNPSARVALQQRVSKNLLFTFSTDVSQPGNEIVQGEYQINKRWSASVTRDQLGGVSVDGKFHTRF
jgi:translocation and assembly module TamB